MTARLILKTGREKSVLRRHPWIFSGSVDRIEGSPSIGTTVNVTSSSGEALGWAAYSSESQIRARMWSWNHQETIDTDFFKQQLSKAIDRRKLFIKPDETDAYRLVHGESDGLPGLIVDRYGDYLVMQCLSAGIEYWRETLASLLVSLTGVANVYERSDGDVRELEGLGERVGPMRGATPSKLPLITENGLKFWVDIEYGHKTGFYLDQRLNRAYLRDYVKDRTVLNCFSYTGAFAVYALAGGAASVLSIDSSTEALELGAVNVAANDLDASQAEWLEGDVFQELRTLRDQARHFDVIILDPPKFAPTAAQVERAARGYKDINLLAFKLLSPGGLLFTFSCSGGVSAELFQKIVAGAALDAGVNATIHKTLTQGPDHPVALNFPEGAYLKGLVCNV
jgi:23S rRNA (cytosine1962-C5)-methyltransferase